MSSKVYPGIPDLEMAKSADSIQYTELSSLKGIVNDARQSFESGLSNDLKWRLGQLRSIRKMLKENETSIVDALKRDLGRPHFEAVMGDIVPVLAEVEELAARLPRLTRRRRVRNPLAFVPATVYHKPEPLGVILIITPWNFPFSLPLQIMAGAIAAGNTLILKLSEESPASSNLLEQLINKYLDTSCIKVVQGGRAAAAALLAPGAPPVDHVCFTGGQEGGRAVAALAAAALVPCTLELGGKNPAYVHADAALAPTARKLVQGRCLNAGQVCVAPDWVLVHADAREALVAELARAAREFYGEDAQASPDFGRIVNLKEFDRLQSMLDQMHSGKVITIGGRPDRAALFFPPTLVVDPEPAARVAREELFGPVLVLRTVRGPDEAIDLIRARPKPLSAYVFTQNKSVQLQFETRVSSGNMVFNETCFQTLHPNLNFGGVGQSGTGAYRVSKSFETFSHMKAVMSRPIWFDPFLRYPPFAPSHLRAVRGVYDGTLAAAARLGERTARTAAALVAVLLVWQYWPWR